MNIIRMELTNFRNIAAALIEPGDGVNVFFGDNGAGKTNLLEAVFVLCLARSQRGARDLMMVGEGENDFFRLEGIGRLSGNGGEVRLAVAYQKNGRKRITIDGNPSGSSRLFQTSVVISMAPEDVALFAGSPSIRRHFLDLYISQASPSYLADLTDYAKALAQKNAFLKNTPGGFCPFDPILIQCGSRIAAARGRFIGFLKTLAPEFYQKISGHLPDDEPPEFAISYCPNIPFREEDQIAETFAARLEAMRKKEEILQTAMVGPHRDDIEFAISGFP
ncbi:MAG: DNA replication and repair protein RecF, partial [candidate division Zixibacteria bacterium]|nr:DNA replication and repair protein RecF [candidate division Zixibacteria bacterium]